jgi:diguanylate cyclase (GGDEF)-like protein
MLTRAIDLTTDPDVGGIVLNLHGASERKAVEEALEHRALHDALTGFPNRVLRRGRIEQALRRAARNTRQIAVVYVDLDGFKRINDSLGHDAGDELLRGVTDRLSDSVRPADTVARLGGDEFAILIEETGHHDVAIEVADRMVEALRAPILVGGRQSSLCKPGPRRFHPNATAMSLLRDADVAMYRAKAVGGDRWVRYEPEMRAFIEEQLQLEATLSLRSTRTSSIAVSAGHEARYQHARGLRGTPALASPHARADQPGSLHPDRRADRADRSHRTVGARGGVRDAGSLVSAARAPTHHWQ